LSAADRDELERHVKVFLAEKAFAGAQGLEVTEAMRVTVAAHACILLLHRETSYYPRLDTIALYPSAFVSEIKEAAFGTVMASQVPRTGESNDRTGVLVLAWDRAWADAQTLGQGKDLVFHEFAHQLDGEDGTVDGAPPLPSRERYGAWAHVLGKEYQDLDAEIARHRATWIDPYAATNPAEFFAVATEMFFKAPRGFRAHSAELYDQFSAFFRLDPAALFAAAGIGVS
jgi:Mlc titration factor MtfA (ptsG expression regulator)